VVACTLLLLLLLLNVAIACCLHTVQAAILTAACTELGVAVELSAAVCTQCQRCRSLSLLSLTVHYTLHCATAEAKALSHVPLLVRAFQDDCALMSAAELPPKCIPQFAFGLCQPDQTGLVPYHPDSFTK
jgi:hypothetical protein